ncbi:unnamed protein product [Amoebophrya sp. A120]|nr:unnamed protein product [Amoebophrya sp. A120]|eukprot:GSA120T00025193001.1
MAQGPFLDTTSAWVTGILNLLNTTFGHAKVMLSGFFSRQAQGVRDSGSTHLPLRSCVPIHGSAQLRGCMFAMLTFAESRFRILLALARAARKCGSKNSKYGCTSVHHFRVSDGKDESSMERASRSLVS